MSGAIVFNVKKLLRNKITHAFLTQDGQWTTDAQNAREVDSEFQVDSLKQQAEIDDLEIYYCFGDSDTSCYDFAISCT